MINERRHDDCIKLLLCPAAVAECALLTKILYYFNVMYGYGVIGSAKILPGLHYASTASRTSCSAVFLKLFFIPHITLGLQLVYAHFNIS